MRKGILLNVGGIDVFEGMELEGISDVDGWWNSHGGKVYSVWFISENDKGYMGNEGKWFIHLRGTMHIYSDSELDEGYLWRWWRVNGV